MLATPTTWSFPTRVRFGSGTIASLADACRDAGVTRPLLVTDAGLAKLPLVEQIRRQLESAGLPCAIYSDVRSNPSSANIDHGVEVFRAGNHDGVVAVGGGSGLDAGKLIAFMTAQTRPIWDFEDVGDWWTRATTGGVAPIVAVPTTAGTGSEVGRAGVVTDEASHVKKVIFHPLMLPRTSILDPQLTVGLPPFLTAATGMDAFAHSLEAYCAKGFHPMADGIAVEGMRLVKEALLPAFKDGDNIAARAMMLAASAMGAVAFQKGLGAIHALSHPIGAVYDTHHGLTNAVVMPYVLRFNRPAIADKMDRLASWLDLDGSGLEGSGLDRLIDFVLALRRDLGIPHTLEALGVPADRFDELAAMAIVDPTAGGNPVPLDQAAARQLYRHAFEGTLPS